MKTTPRIVESLLAESRIDILRKIVQDHQAAKVDGTMVDAFTASMLVKVHDALGPANQAKFQSLPLLKLIDFGWKQVK